MPNILPIDVDLGYCEQGRYLTGELALDSLPRLNELVYKCNGSVQVDFTFGIDETSAERKIRYVKGTLTATLELICQRCLEPMVWQIDKPVFLGLSKFDNELEELPDHYDPYLTDKGIIVLADLVEQELILSLPLIAKHKLEDCPASDYVTKADDQPAADVQKPNPFEVLKDLKLKK